MKDFIGKIITIKNIFGLLTIVLYFGYVGVNMHLNKGNTITNITLLVLTIIYLMLYIYSVFVENNKKIKKGAKRFFTRSKKFLGFVNACMVIAAVFSNQNNSFLTIFLAITTIVGFFIYMFLDISSIIVFYRLKRFKRELNYNFSDKNKIS